MRCGFMSHNPGYVDKRFPPTLQGLKLRHFWRNPDPRGAVRTSGEKSPGKNTRRVYAMRACVRDVRMRATRGRDILR